MNETDTDNVFGPRHEGSFDFTLLFEQSILSVLPSALLVCVATVRIWWLGRKEVQVRAGKLLGVKLVCVAHLQLNRAFTSNG